MSERAPTPRRLRRAILASALGGLTLLAMGADYRGCAPEEGPDVPDDGAPLPEGTGCIVDDDCVSMDVCVAFECRAGRCVEVGVGMDDDGDGFAPMPCGGDCNDGDPNRFPGAGERCDGIDQDCDGVVDEGAIGASAEGISDGLENATMVAAGSAFVVLGDGEGSSDGLFGYLVATDGSSTARARVADDIRIPRAVVGSDDGTVRVIGVVAPDATLVILTLSASGGALAVTEGPTEIASALSFRAVAAARFADQTWVAYDTRDADDTTRRWLWRSGSGAPIVLEPDPADGAPDLATDGISMVVTEGAQTLRFVDAAGETVASRDLPGPFADQPIADGDGEVYAVYRDAFDHAIQRVTDVGSTSPIAAPVGSRSDSVGVFRIEEGVLVTRIDRLALRAWVLDHELGLYEATFPPASVSPISAPPLAVTAATLSSGLSAIHTRYGGTSGIALLTCEAR